VVGTVGGVRGELLRWAREQQTLTMRWIHDHHGPSPAYQSEVEQGKKSEVQSATLDRWLQLLNVTEPFVRGLVTKYHHDAVACRGLAADAAEMVMAGQGDRPDWSAMSEQERVRQVLRLIISHSKLLPRVVLAWVLDMDVLSLEAVMDGGPVQKVHVQAAAELTLLPATFFTLGTTAQFEQYIPVFHRAVQLGVSPAELLRMIDLRPARRHVSVRRLKRPG
jgi:transcriptional regulator with XRE-family HTH domain